MDFLVLIGNNNGDKQLTIAVMVQFYRFSGGVSCTVTHNDACLSLCVHELGLVRTR